MAWVVYKQKRKKGKEKKKKRENKKGKGKRGKEGKRKREVAREIKRQLAQIKPGVQISSDLGCARLDFRETQDS